MKDYFESSVRIDEKLTELIIKAIEITGESESEFIKTSIIERCQMVASAMEEIRNCMDNFAKRGLVQKNGDGSYSVDKSQMHIMERIIEEYEDKEK